MNLKSSVATSTLNQADVFPGLEESRHHCVSFFCSRLLSASARRRSMDSAEDRGEKQHSSSEDIDSEFLP